MMTLNGQLHTSAVFLYKEPPEPNGKKGGSPPEPFLTLWWKKKPHHLNKELKSSPTFHSPL
jgi:hypothetical protein